jgi:small subunit ribosomal protein S20
MPNSISSKKRLRQNDKRAQANKVVRTAMRTLEKRVKERIAAGDKKGAEALVPQLYQRLDKAAKKHIIHANTAANHKSRITRRIAGL